MSQCIYRPLPFWTALAMHIDEYEKQQPVYELFAKTVASILTAAIEHAGDYRLQVVDRPEFCRQSVVVLRVSPFKLYR